MTLRIGVIGLGMMGQTHLDVYASGNAGAGGNFPGGNLPGRVVAVADRSVERLRGSTKAGGNIAGQAEGGFDLDSVRKFEDANAMFEHVDVVDICTPTMSHFELAKSAIAAGKHVLIEKPVCRTYEQARELADLAGRARGKTMVAMCMRFWPGWTHLHDAVATQQYGSLRSLSFRRVGSHPGGVYTDADASGAAILDLHLHDADFVRHLLGEPTAVRSVGSSFLTAGIDHVATQYDFDGRHAGATVTAEGGWAMQPGFPFTIRYTANFDDATLDFDLGRTDAPLLCYRNGEAETVATDGMGYTAEIRHFLACIEDDDTPAVSIADAAESIRLIEAEARSVRSGTVVRL